MEASGTLTSTSLACVQLHQSAYTTSHYIHTYIQGRKFWVLSFGVLRRKRFHILGPNLAEEISRSQKHSMHTRKDTHSISAHIPAKVHHQQRQSFVHTSI